MRRLIPLLAITLALVAPAASSANDANKDYATGDGSYFFTKPDPSFIPRTRTFVFDVRQRGSHKAFGNWQQNDTQFPSVSFAGDVTCLKVVGKLAAFGGVMTDAGHAGTPFVVWVADGGPRDSGLDQYSSAYVPQAEDYGTTVPTDFPATCPEPVSPIGYFPVLTGDIVVNDGKIKG